MASVTIPFTFTNGAGNTADATQVNSNFTAIANFVNSDLIQRDGTVAMTQPLSLSGDPTLAAHAARKAYVDAQVGATPPIGSMLMFAGAAAPTNYLLCQGQAVSRVTYASLFAVLGTSYGVGDGSSTFNLPDMRGRVPVGLNSGDGDFDSLSDAGGAKTHQLQTTNLPPHQHTINHNHGTITSTGQSANHTHALSGSTSTDGNHVHGFSSPAGGSPNGVMLTTAGTASFALGNGGTLQANATYANQMDTTGAHAHSVSGTTAGVSADHTHNVAIPDFSGQSGSGPGQSGSINHMNPYRVVNYIIRAA